MNLSLVIRRTFTVFLCFCLIIPLAGCGADVGEKVKIVVPDDLSIRAADLRYEDGVQFVDSQLLLIAKDGTDYNTVERLTKEAGGEIIGYISFSGDYHIDFPTGKTYEELTALLENWSSEEFVENVSLHRIFMVEPQSVDYKNDPWKNTSGSFSGSSHWSQSHPDGNNWWAEAIRLPDVWDMDIWNNLPEEPVKIGLIDDGFYLAHQDLDSVFADVWYNDGSVVAHGTSMSGLIAAEMGNGVAIAGVASCADPELYGFSLVPVMNWEGTTIQGTYPSDIILKYAISMMLEQGVRAINCSIGSDEMLYAAQFGKGEKQDHAREDLNYFSQSMCYFLKRALDAGYDFLIMQSAGNASGKVWTEVSYDVNPYGYQKKPYVEDYYGPICSANYDYLGAITDPTVRSHIITVGAAERKEFSDVFDGVDYVRSLFSCIDCDVYAPGTDILSLDVGTVQTYLGSGTSQATAIVTGVAGLIWAVNPDLTAQQVKQIITISADYRVLENNNFYSPEEYEDQVTVVDAAFAVHAAREIAGTGNQEATKASVTGYVYTQTKADDGTIQNIPLENSDILITAADGSKTKLKTSQWGSFDVFLPAGEYSVSLELEGYYPYEQVICLQEREAVYLRIKMDQIPLVSDAYHSHAPSYELDGGIHFYIPRVNLPGDLAAEVNNAIYHDLIGYVRKDASYDRGMNYLWAQKDSMISILVLTGEDYNTAMSQFYVYNVSVDSGDILSNNALWEAYGLTETEYYGRLNEIVDEYYKELNTASLPDSYQEYLQNQIERSLSAENLDAAMPYVDESGDLCVMIKLYSLAGPDYHYYLYNLTGTAAPKRPEYRMHETFACENAENSQSPYQQYLENGCYYPYLEAGETAEGYAILDINGDGVDELIIDAGWKTQEFHNHLIYTMNERNQISYVSTIYSYHCVRHSTELGALGYVYPRGSMVTLYHCCTIENGGMYESHTLYGDHYEGVYTVTQFDSSGNEIASIQEAKEEYEGILAAFQGISWVDVP